MNFYITTNNSYDNDLNLNYTKIKNFHIYHDDDWIIDNNILKKGTAQSYCQIKITNKLQILHNDPRDFPLWYNKDSCTTLFALKNYLPVDGTLTYDVNKWHITYKKNYYKTSNQTYDKEKTINFCIKLLVKNTKKFLSKNNKKLIIFDSNGLDSLLARSIMDYLKVKYTLTDIKKLQYTNLQNKLIEKYYGFNQIQLFAEPTCIISGFYGDEYLLRSPSYVQGLIKQDVIKIFEKHSDCYMKKFFEVIYKEKCKKIKPQSKQKLKEMIANDIQIWHIDKTYVFSPFKHMKFLELLNCNNDIIKKQVTDGWLSKKLIEYFNPKLVSKIDKFKNMNDPFWFEY